MGVVPHVQHLVVLAHVRDSMTTSVLRSSRGGGSRPPDGALAARRPPILAERSQFHYRLTLGSPPWKRPKRGGDRRKPISIRSYIYFLTNFCVLIMCTLPVFIYAGEGSQPTSPSNVGLNPLLGGCWPAKGGEGAHPSWA